MKSYIYLALLLIISACNTKQKEIIELSDNWTLQSIDKSIAVHTKLPSTVQQTLLDNHLIPQPYVNTHEDSVQWIAKKEWFYELNFDTDANTRNKKSVFLFFKGIDTYSTIYLNDHLLGKTNNVFRTWKWEVSALLKPTNTIRIHLKPTLDISDSLYNNLPYRLPDDSRVMTRKSPYHFGWDWAPKLYPTGIYEAVKLIAFDHVQISGIQFHTDSIIQNKAYNRVSIEIESNNTNKYNIILDIGQEIKTRQKIEVKEGLNTLNFPVQMDNPQLWYPNGMGDAHLYPLKIQLKKGLKILDLKTLNIGIRQINLKQEVDSIGKSFEFQVNGKPLFIKGANYVPHDVFLDHFESARYERIILSAKQANMNMLRVWGGGWYERDYFYELCDKHGIMVWQDFMFACAMYPGDTDFLKNIELEAIDQVKRLQHHPSIVLWCGNNEIKEGWYNWGWQKAYGYSSEDSTEIWENYTKIFNSILPEVVKTADPNRFYWHSSPSNGWGRDLAYTEGDVHYWGVWWGMEPFKKYIAKTGRFVSEYGFQSIPYLSTISRFADSSEWSLQSESVKSHQKHPVGNETIMEYMQRDYKVPEHFNDLIYVSQLLQSRGIGMAIEAHRRAKPFCMGTLYWQLNDCWPAISWSSMDYYQNWKALHFHAKKLYSNVLISPYIDARMLHIHVISDQYKAIEGELYTELMNYYGEIVYSDSAQIKIPQNSSNIFKSIHLTKFIKEKDFGKYIAVIRLKTNTKEYVRSILLTKPKKTKLPFADIKTQISVERNKVRIELKSTVYAHKVFVQYKNSGSGFTDNFFDLIPNKPVIIYYNNINTNENFKKQFSVTCLNNLYD